jgi:Tol biopolymer transport system component
MRFLKALTALLLVAAAGTAGWFGFRLYSQAQAHDLEGVIVEEAPPQPSVPQTVARTEDPRIASYKDRGDGARLVWSPEPTETLLRAGFIDNGSMLVSATNGASSKLLSFDLSSGKTSPKIETALKMSASSHRPAHKNADTLCFSQQTDGVKTEVWCTDMAGKKPRRVTTHDGPEDLVEASVSPDGNWVVFEVNVDRAQTGKKEPARSAIWKIGLNGANLQQLTRGGDDRFPSWSEDGRKIYFQRRMNDGHWDAYEMFADGTNPGPFLRTYGESERWPMKRAGSDEAVFSVETDDASPRIKKLNLETKSGAWLTSGAYGAETHPSLSPDGKLVSFLAPVDPSDPRRLGLWIAPIEP